MQNKQNTKAKVIVIAIAILLCLALVVGITGAFYQAQRRATGTVKMDKGIVIDYIGFGKEADDIWQRETTTTFRLFSDTDVQPGEKISLNDAGIKANTASVDFYARVKLSYEFYNVVGDVETPVALANPSDLITTSATFFGADWVDSGAGDGYYYYATGTTLNKFTKATPATFVDLFDTNARFIIEGAGFTGAYPDGEGGGFVIDETTSINKIVVYLTLETLQGDATPEQAQALGWKIEKPVVFADATAKLETSVGKVETTENLNVSVGGAAEVPLNAVVFPYDTTTTLEFDSKNVEYVELTYSNGEKETFLELPASEESATKYSQIAVTANSSKGTVTAYTVGIFGSSEYKGFTYSYESAYEDPSDSDNTLYAPMPEGTVALTGYLGTATEITIPSSVRIRERDFKLVFEGYTSVDEAYNLIGSNFSALMTIKYPCTLNSTQTLNSFEDFINVVIGAMENMSNEDFMAAYPTLEFKYKALCETSNLLYSPKAVKEIDIYAFRELSIQSVIISAGIDTIDYYAFSDCGNLEIINIPNSVTSIGNFAFSSCSSLQSIDIPNSVTSIGEWAFYDCGNLQARITEGNIAYLGNESNSYLVAWKVTDKTQTSYTINNNCKFIYDDCFRDCSSARSITIPNGVTSIGVWAFYGCSGLTSITIPDSVTSIGNSAFQGCSSLETISIPESVISIGYCAFEGCSGLTSITVAAGNSVYHSEGNCLIETASKTLIAGCKNSIIPTDGSVTSIRYDAFRNCSGLTSITIPDSVTSIGASAFSACHNLTTTIGDGWVKVEDGSAVAASTLLKDISYDIRRNA